MNNSEVKKQSIMVSRRTWLNISLIAISLGGAILVYRVSIESVPWQRTPTRESVWGSRIESLLGVPLPESVWEKPLDSRREYWVIAYSVSGEEFSSLRSSLKLAEKSNEEFSNWVRSFDERIPRHLVPNGRYLSGVMVRSINHDGERFEFWLSAEGTVIVSVHRRIRGEGGLNTT